MKKNGFVSTSLIYTFFIVFLLLMVFLLNSYSRVRYLLEEFKYEIKDSFASRDLADINLTLMVWNDTTNEYEIADSIPAFGYELDPGSYCDANDNATIKYSRGNISVAAEGKADCYAYFKRLGEQDIILNIFTKETLNSEKVQVNDIPDRTYRLSEASCENGASIEFDDVTREFNVSSEYRTICEVTFIKNEMDIILNLFKEDVNGIHEYNGSKYTEIYEIPGSNYTLKGYKCNSHETNNDKDDDTIITTAPGTNELNVEALERDECNVYFGGGTDTVEIFIMQESDTGVAGITTGKLYTRVYSIPDVSIYSYVGYICPDNNEATVTYSDGILTGESPTQATCYAYFNKLNSGNVLINYYLEKSDGSYENVSSVPSVGFIYNEQMSNCQNGSTITVNNNIVSVSATNTDVCNVYFDLAIDDIRVLVYVMNRETQKYELGKIPIGGYSLYSSGCTNGASIEYVNSTFKVDSEGPTVCTVYFR